MSSLSKKWFVIINPTSGNGKSKKKWPEIKQLLELHGFEFEFVFTEYSGHSVLLVQEAIDNNFMNIICVGGDGTLHNIVNGIMSQNKILSKNIHVGMIPIGTGNDWVKTHHIPMTIKSAIETIFKGNILTQDIGKIELLNKNSIPVYFNNLAGIGFDAYVANKVHKYKYLGPLAYLFGAIIGLFSFKKFNAIVSVESHKYSNKNLMILVGLCKYSGGGMRLTQNPDPFDGLFDISIAQNLSKIEIIKNLGRLFNGKIVFNKKVTTLKAAAIDIELIENGALFAQADGEIIGSGGFKATIIPKAFTFYC
ncbi:diacylglycerol kinase family protein [Gaetbulibacter aquiaggeris]|uniref:Diacylglycerol kinase family protein n=1 Tax=Gaetbulibacter aquiaggeris TaxID=1735373 RepID=A0ABW7ML44_9FLAO